MAGTVRGGLRRGLPRALRLVAALLALAAPACDRPAEAPAEGGAQPPADATHGPEETISEIDRLRALGYLDYADEVVAPGQDAVPVHDPGRMAPGHNLYVIRALSRAELIDADGTVVRTWQHEPSDAWSNAELTEAGDLLVQGGHAGRSYLLRLAWNGDVIWKRWLSVHHDVEPQPDGSLAVLFERERRVPDFDDENVLLDHGIALLDPQGHPLEEFSFYDMLSRSGDVLALQRVAPSRGRLDLFHSNSVEFMRPTAPHERSPLYAEQNALVSLRHQDAVVIFDLQARRAVWAWGPGEISGPHDATVLENGNILLFDNGLGRGWSRVVELDPLARRIVWQYRAPEPGDFYTAGRGSSQRLANGNTLIANSDSGEAFEVTPEGELVWKFLNPHADARGRRATIVRMKRYSPAFLARIDAARGLH